VLGAAIGAAHAAGRDKLTLVISPDIASFGSWIEQLVAESSGKEGKGIVPIDLEPLGSPQSYGADRFFVYIRSAAADGKQDAAVAALERAGQPVVTIAVDRRESLGREIYRWEMATAIACAVMGVNPFDEPNVTEAKQATQAVLSRYLDEGTLPARQSLASGAHLEVEAPAWLAETLRRKANGGEPPAWLAALLAHARAGDYVALLAYLHRTPERHARLEKLRLACRAATRLATTLGYGPRFLHSTGQYHKGGPANGLFVQFTADEGDDLPIPGERYGFGVLRAAQAMGDYQVLGRRERRVLRIHLGRDVERGLDLLIEAVEAVRV